MPFEKFPTPPEEKKEEKIEAEEEVEERTEELEKEEVSMGNPFEHPTYKEEDTEIKTPEELEEAKQMAGVTTHEEAMRRFEEYEALAKEGKLYEKTLVSRKEQLNERGDILQISEYVYDERSSVTKEKITTPDGKTIAEYNYRYDEKGRKTETKETVRTDYGLENYVIEMNYDSKGNMAEEIVKKITEKGNEIPLGSYQYTHEFIEGGRRTTKFLREPSGKVKEKTSYHYDREGRLLREQKRDAFEYYTDGKIAEDYEYVYDEKGRPKEKIERDEKGNAWLVTEFSYDENGNVIKEIKKSADRKFTHGTSLYKFSYEKK